MQVHSECVLPVAASDWFTFYDKNDVWKNDRKTDPTKFESTLKLRFWMRRRAKSRNFQMLH